MPPRTFASNIKTSAQSGTPFSITDASGKEAYPIATFTFLLLPQQIRDRPKKAACLSFSAGYRPLGQRECAALGYAPLPHDFAVQQVRLLNSLN
jgi:phosphate transport system substrate-binding protein